MSNAAMVALYARVSSEQQSKRGTIDSQIAALKERIQADGAQIVEDMCFVDAGVSGATLVRPQLERLRDAAALGAIDRLYILSPDRLARKYAYQALLMEELGSYGVQVVFLNHAIGTTPEESLLLQMQGMISEYERAKIAERNRRGSFTVQNAVLSMCYQGRLTATAISDDSSTGRQPGTSSNCRKRPR